MIKKIYIYSYISILRFAHPYLGSIAVRINPTHEWESRQLLKKSRSLVELLTAECRLKSREQRERAKFA